MEQDYRKKITFWLRLSGWLCLIPATVYLYFYQMVSDNSMAYLFLIELIIIVLFAVYILTTAKSPRWYQPSRLLSLIIFAFFFVSIVICIPLFLAYRNCQKMQN